MEMQVVFWQNILSPHQAPFLSALADLGHEVTVVAEESMDAGRLELGWKVPEMGHARIVIGPGEAETRQLIERSSREAIHVIAGARCSPLGDLVVGQCLASGRRVGIMSEAPDPRGIGGWGRWAKYTLERYTKGSRYDFVLAMGEMGVRWFRHCGYPARRVFPFAYVTESAWELQARPPEVPLTILFVGRLVHLKGVDLLIRAFATLPADRARLCVVGTGPEEEALRQLAKELGVGDSVVWAGAMKQSMVSAAMARADVLVLPSRKDGWGAVVNESLMVGTPVICSTACGAAELIREPWLGSVFRSKRVGELAGALRHWVESGPRSQCERERIQGWARCIGGQAVAEYFAAVMEHVYSGATRPLVPWRRPLGDLKPLASVS